MKVYRFLIIDTQHKKDYGKGNSLIKINYASEQKRETEVIWWKKNKIVSPELIVAVRFNN